MRIGLDYGGVIDNDPNTWVDIIKSLIISGHQIYILSHAHPGKDEIHRQDLANNSGAINISFSDIMDEKLIEQRKANLAVEYKIDLFVDDYFNRCQVVHNLLPTVGIICIHYSQQGLTQQLLKGLS